MQILIVTIVIISFTHGKSIEPLTNQLIDYNNTILRDDENIDGLTDDYVKNHEVTLIESGQLIKPKSYQTNKSVDLPHYFDSREFWPDCNSIAMVSDQGACGSCWAVSTVSSMSDRLCIQSNGTINVQLSAEEVLSCCTDCGVGCRNGFAMKAFQYWIDYGIVTSGCLSYSIPPCEHHVNGTRSDCEQLGFSVTPFCSNQCSSTYGKDFISDKYYGIKSYSLSEPEDIMTDILTNGPVAARMVIYTDFYSHKLGVYKHVTGEKLGYHTVKLIGWGSDQGVDYWLAVNTWNTDWGDNGFFKIERGNNECDIESDVMAGLPRL